MVRDGERTSRELVEESLEAIERRDDELNAFVHVDPDGALAAADAIGAGDERPFAGVPIAIKANIPAAGHVMDFGSRLLEGFHAMHDAHLVRRLREADRKIGSLALLDVYGRVARLLLDMSENVDGEKIVTKRLPKQDIAKMIGASREMVSRVMKDLQTGGYIEMRGSNIVLRDTIMLPE